MVPQTTEEQSHIAQQFREECLRDGILKPDCDTANDERTLLRFLRARQYNIENAKKMLKNCEEWRAAVGGGVGMEEFYKEDNNDPFNYPERELVFQHWPLFFHKTDKKGRPINIHKFGSINIPELMKVVSSERFTDILTANCELLTREVLPACSKAAGKRIETVLVIVDLKGFSISQFWAMKDFVRTSFQISQDYYPETMGQVAVINAPMTFTTMWSAIKPWLAKETVEKVDILGSHYEDALLKLVDADSLPKDLGGSCTCDDHGGDCTTSNAGPWMDDRVERRKAWQRGERSKIAVDWDDKDAPASQDIEHASPSRKISLSAVTGAEAAPDAPLQAAVEIGLPPSAPETPISGHQMQPNEASATEPTVVQTINGEERAPSTVAPVIIDRPRQTVSSPSDAHTTDFAPESEAERAQASDDTAMSSQQLNGLHKSIRSGASSRLSVFLHPRHHKHSTSTSSSSIDEANSGVRKSKLKAAVERVVDKIVR